jgi:hypothetical protein
MDHGGIDIPFQIVSRDLISFCLSTSHFLECQCSIAVFNKSARPESLDLQAMVTHEIDRISKGDRSLF